jgi:hypothetical protein
MVKAYVGIVNVYLDMVHVSYGMVTVPKDMLNVSRSMVMSLCTLCKSHILLEYMDMVNDPPGHGNSNCSHGNVSQDMIQGHLDMIYVPP